MAFAIASSAHEPLSEINTTPLIDVLLVLLIVLVMAVPLATNSLEIELPSGEIVERQPDAVRNLLVIETDGDLLWNGRAVDERELAGQLAQVRAMSPEPEVQFRPEANASYERSAQVLRIVKQARIGNFGMVGNEQYRTFGAGR
jgi:biopolymer transport protein ExbD